MGENGSEFRVRDMLGPTVSTPSGGDLHLEKQLCKKEPVSPHRGSSLTTVDAAAIAAVAIANGY